MRWFVLACLALIWPGAAKAAWMESSSEHFVVYADDSESDVREFSERLERFHAAMALLTNATARVPSPSNRVTVFVVRNQREVRKLHGEDSKYVAGFYVPRAGASVAIVPRINTGGEDIDFSMVVLLHEYAHHFFISSSAFPLPRWLSEGAAEFFASAKFDKDGSVSVGRPALHRAGELFLSRDVSAEELLDPEVYEAKKSRYYDAFYGKSWLLYHYLHFEPSRQGQLMTYFRLMASGEDQREAAVTAFGDFKSLDKELDRYLGRRKMTVYTLPPRLLKIGPVSVRELTDGEAAIMPLKIRSRRGVTQEEADEIVVEMRALAARYRADPAVLAALAEAEYDSGNDEAAIEAADAALAIDPERINAYIQKGYALFRMAGDADDPDAAFLAARAPFIALNRLENDHPLPLYFYYRSFIERGDQPSELAMNGLQRAVELAPFDEGLRMTLAMERLREGDAAGARLNLVPIAYNPHGGSAAASARAIIERIDSDPSWDGSGAESLVSSEDAGDGE